MPVLHYFRLLESPHHASTLKNAIEAKLETAELSEDAALVKSSTLQIEHCFNVDVTDMSALDVEKEKRLEWLLSETYTKTTFSKGHQILMM